MILYVLRTLRIFCGLGSVIGHEIIMVHLVIFGAQQNVHDVYDTIAITENNVMILQATIHETY